MKIVAIQPALQLGQVEANLKKLEQLILAAYQEHTPDVIVLPESMTSPNVYSPQALLTPQPLQGQPLQLLIRLAKQLNVVITGGFVAIRDGHTYGTYVMVERNGDYHLHDKDIPTAWEQNFYRGGSDDGVVDSSSLNCKVALLSGWEWARFRTAKRVREQHAQLILGGMCWYSMPINWYGLLGTWMRREHEIYKQQSEALPAQMARLTGIPVVHAAHVGEILSDMPMLPYVKWLTEMVGETQICDAAGNVLARMSLADGEGYIAAEIELAEPKPVEPLASSYWIPDMTLTSKLAWHVGNLHGGLMYRVRHRLKKFPWQKQLK